MKFVLILMAISTLVLGGCVIGNAQGAKTQCTDGIDNDADNLIDYPKDPGCISLRDNKEWNPPFCGDGFCKGAENCSSCANDCRACLAFCGDKACNGAETCLSCPVDCGVCPPICGDGSCNGAENCTSCPSDCGACPTFCGDGGCNVNENCTTCPTDCGQCGPVCGDGLCQSPESPLNCRADCGACARNADCGVNGYTEVPYCRYNFTLGKYQVVQNYGIFTCRYPSIPSASCFNSTSIIVNETCQGGCSSGKCSSVCTQACVDSDSLDFDVFGTVNMTYIGCEHLNFEDVCNSTKILTEQACSGNSLSQVVHNCSADQKNCSQGKCV